MAKPPIRLNIGCGETKLKGYVNIDLEKKVKPDIILDVRREALPFKVGTVSQINCIHNIEHIESKYWPIVFSEWNRVLRVGGRLILAYPEFEKCVKNLLTNHQGMKEFWKATLYGRQLYPGDFHVTPIITQDLIVFLMKFGFTNIKHGPEEGQEFNTFLFCTKDKHRPITREAIVKREIFGK